MRGGFPGPVVRLLAAAFALSLVGLRAPGVVVEQVGPMRGLWLTAAPAGCVALTSGLLAFHCKFDGYTRGDEILLRVCVILSTGILLFSGIWAAAIALFG